MGLCWGPSPGPFFGYAAGGLITGPDADGLPGQFVRGAGIQHQCCPPRHSGIGWGVILSYPVSATDPRLRPGIASMVAGFLSIPVFKFIIPSIDGIGSYFEQIAELAPSFFMGLLVGYLVSKWKPSRDIEQHFQQLLK